MSASGPSSSKQSAAQTTQSTTGPLSPAISGKGNRVNFGNDLSGASNVTLNQTDMGAVQAAFDFAGGLAAGVSQLFASQSENQAKTVEMNNALLGQAIAGFGDLGKTTATGGQSDFNKTILWLGLGAAGLVALLIFSRR